MLIIVVVPGKPKGFLDYDHLSHSRTHVIVPSRNPDWVCFSVSKLQAPKMAVKQGERRGGQFTTDLAKID